MGAKKEKIRISVTKTEIKEVSISFPYYVKGEYISIKFFNKNKGIIVADYVYSKHIEYMLMPEEWLSYEPTTEEEFNAKFKEVMTALIDINNEKTI